MTSWEQAETAQKQDLTTFLDFGYIPTKEKEKVVKRPKKRKKQTGNRKGVSDDRRR